mgnify:CR=1 FL=1
MSAAQRALDELGITDVALCGLAKRLEEVWMPGDKDPLILPRTSEGMYLLQRIRDEAHRFAIVGHRARRAHLCARCRGQARSRALHAMPRAGVRGSPRAAAHVRTCRGTRDRRRLRVGQHHRVSVCGRDLGDPRAHGAGTDHANDERHGVRCQVAHTPRYRGARLSRKARTPSS